MTRSLNGSGRYDVVLTQVSSVDFYPSVLNQANLLAEAGLRVLLLDGGTTPPPAGLRRDVTLVRPLAERNASTGRRLVDSVKWKVRFVSAVAAAQRAASGGTRIAYDVPAVTMLGMIPFQGRTVWHLHEPPFIVGTRRASQVIQNRMARRFLHDADLIVVPDRDRARLLEAEEHLAKTPRVVPNCPRRLETLPPGRLKQHLREQGHPVERIVLFQGAVSRNYYADATIASIPWWPDDAVAVFVGRAEPALEAELRRLAETVGVRERVFFLGPVPYDRLFFYTVDAAIGLGLCKPVSPGFRYAAGASNKRFEYMACGVPQITDSGPGVNALMDRTGAGICLGAVTPETLGLSIAALLRDPERLQAMAKAARAAHLTTFNYERQFAPMLDYILSSVGNEAHETEKSPQY